MKENNRKKITMIQWLIAVGIALIVVGAYIRISTLYKPYAGTRLTVTALNTTNEGSQDTGVELIGFMVDKKFYPIADQKTDGVWKENKNGYLSWNSYDKIDGKTDSITFNLPEGNKRYILFTSDRWKGRVNINVDGKNETVDMYNSNGGEATHEIHTTARRTINWNLLTKECIVIFVVFFLIIFMIYCINENKTIKVEKSKDKKKRNRCLNTLKGFASIGVVFGHCQFPGTLGSVLSVSAICAVPIFSMVSGYYCYSENMDSVQLIIPRKIKNIFSILIIACILSIVINFFKSCVLYSMTFKHCFFQGFNFKNFKDVIVNTSTSFTNNGVLWFLIALIYCYLIWLFVNKFNLYKIAYLMVPVIFLFNILYQLHLFDGYNVWNDMIHYILPYFIVGNMLSKYNKNVEKLFGNKQLSILIIVSLLVALFLFFMDRTRRLDEIPQISYSIFLFMFAIRNSEMYISRWLEGIGIKYSLIIYIIHFMVAKFVDFFAVQFGFAGKTVYTYFIPIIILISCIVLGNMYFQIRDSIICD